MSRDFAKPFYHSAAWEHTREAYIRRVDGLCERCKALGRLTQGKIVHHKIPLTPQNIHDPYISLNFDNLMYLCKDCHEAMHKQLSGYDVAQPAKYAFDEDGNLVKQPGETL